MIVPLTCVLISTLISSTVTSDFSLKGDPCSEFDSCLAKDHLRTCSCDSDCQLYGTCCHDYKKQQQDLTPANTYSCYSRHAATPVFAKRSCPDDFRGHIDYKRACLDDDEDEMDVKNNLLVTSYKTKITYWNKQCAKCNNELAEDLVFWNIEVFCPKHKNVDGSLIRRNLTFDQDQMRWGLEVDGEFLLCEVKYAQPPYTDEVKHCTKNIISTCPSSYTDKDLATKCSKHYGERKHKFSNAVYKNIHCAICNGVKVNELECPGMMASAEDTADEMDFQEMIEEVFTNGRWLKRPLMLECSKGYSHDPFQLRCRRDELLDDPTEVPISASSTAKGALSTLLVFLLINILI